MFTTRQEIQQTYMTFSAVEKALNLYSRDRKLELQKKQEILDREFQLVPVDHIDSIRGGF